MTLASRYLASKGRAAPSFHYRNACQEAHGGPLPDAVLRAAVVDCQVDPPGSEGNVVRPSEFDGDGRLAFPRGTGQNF